MAAKELSTESRVATSSFRTSIWLVLKWTLFAVVLAFVGWRAWELWQSDEIRGLKVDWLWLVVAGVVYLLGWLPTVWFWRRLMRAVGGDVNWSDTIRAYYCGHLGKYIPGKATVLVIRAGLLKDRGCPAGLAALTSAYETLMLMGVGLGLTVALLPRMFHPSQLNGWPATLTDLMFVHWLPAALVVATLVLVLPVLARLLSWAAKKMTGPAQESSTASMQVPVSLLTGGIVAYIVSWGMLGLSLQLTVRALVDQPFGLADWPMYTGAVSLATSVGFLMIFAPGGVGVREGLLIEVLRVQPDLTAQQAVAIAVVLRLVWLTAEIAAASVLYYRK